MLTRSHKSNPHNEQAVIVAWKVLQKQKILKTGKLWVDQRHLKIKPYEKQQLNLKYHLLRRKYYI